MNDTMSKISNAWTLLKGAEVTGCFKGRMQDSEGVWKQWRLEKCWGSRHLPKEGDGLVNEFRSLGLFTGAYSR